MEQDPNEASAVSTARPRRRLWVRILKGLGILALAIVTAAGATITVARALLPGTCDVAEDRFDKLSMQMSYEAVKEALGCGGVLVEKEDYGQGQVVIEHFAWRGAVWPYGRVRLQFINNTLQGTEKLWLHLRVTKSG
jgi:hypothetical protein